MSQVRKPATAPAKPQGVIGEADLDKVAASGGPVSGGVGSGGGSGGGSN
jgi:hypothetical protein